MTDLYKLIGNRPSSLPVARYCSQAALLSAQHGASRAALLGTAFHAICAGVPDKDRVLSLLSREEREEVMSWHCPLPIEVAGVTLKYADAVKEVPVGLSVDGAYVPPGTPEAPAEALTAGTLDLAWIALVNGQKVAFVGDLKKTHWAAADGPESLQLAAYAIAFAEAHDVDYYAMGIWDCTDGFWQWSELIDRYSLDAGALFTQVKAAALNRGKEFTTGTHCRSCYARLHCPEFLMPATVAKTELAPLCKPDGITKDNALRLAHFILASDDVIKAAKSSLQEWVRRNGPIHDPGTGKMYAPTKMPGRDSLDKKALLAELGDKASKFIKKGEPYEQFRWLKARN